MVRPSEEQDVWLWGVVVVVDPAGAHLDTERSPLVLCQETSLEVVLPGDLFWEDDMPVLVRIIVVFSGIVETVCGGH